MTPPTLREAIEAFNANDLGTILRETGIRDIPKTKEGKVNLWRQQMADPARIRQALAHLKPRTLKALQLLQAMEQAELRTTRFRSLLARAGITQKESQKAPRLDNWVPGRTQALRETGTFDDVLTELLLRGLIWTHTLPEGSAATARIGFEGGRYVYIPVEVAVHLPPAPPRERALPQVTHIVNGSARTCQRDLYLVWSAAREEPLGLVSSGLLRMADLKRLAKQLLIPETISTGTKESDYRRIFFLRRLLSAVDLLAYRPELGELLHTRPDPGFLASAAVERVKTSFESWRNGAWWNELWATYVSGQTRASGTPIDFTPPKIGEARRKVLEVLMNLARQQEKQQQTPQVWVALDDIADYLHDRDEEFLVERGTAESQYQAYRYSYYNQASFSPYQYNQLMWSWGDAYAKSEDDGWNGVERVFIEAVLTEGLYWLGLVDLGYARPVTQEGGKAPEGLLAVRLTDMGRWLLLNGPKPAVPEESGRVVLQPNFRIFAFDPISDSVLARLDAFAVRLNAERAIEYDLTRESVYRAQLAGQTAGQIATWLEQITGAALPQNVARSLDEWQAAFERILVRTQVGWVEAATPELIDALEANPQLQPIIIKRATPTGLIVRGGMMNVVEQTLLAASELPARSPRADEAQRGSIVVAEDGMVRPAHAVSSLYVFGALQPFAERDGDGWRITAASVARAATGGLDAGAILVQLSTLAAGSVPLALQSQIKAWSKHYGSATISTMTLVQFRDQDTLDELRRDSELARVLKPFHPEAKLGLASIAAEQVGRLRDLLRTRGVDVLI